MRRGFFLFIISFSLVLTAFSQDRSLESIREKVGSYFQSYRRDGFTNNDAIFLNDIILDETNHSITAIVCDAFAEQSFTKEMTLSVYREIARLLPSPYNAYRIQICCGATPIEEYIPPLANDSTKALRSWGDIEHKGKPWVTPLSRLYAPTKGMAGRHITLWASHGRYFDLKTNVWRWQRPSLFCTCEDLFTQSFTVPFLMPMLENAGAIIFTPRERDWQRHEIIVDNDSPANENGYIETNGTYEWQSANLGFGANLNTNLDQENPFQGGTYRVIDAQSSKRLTSSIIWQPEIPEEGEYAVYVSYASLPNSINDAQYTVIHQGTSTKFKVNQRMGGGTWAYLGTFYFDKGKGPMNQVVLTNNSNCRGVVTADAVRFGGGMGSIARADSIHQTICSGLPRCLEGSRYTAQWSGMSNSIYRVKDGQNDYAEDLNSRSLMSNYLSRGSVYLPGDSGRNVPIELSLAIHSDAGLRTDSSLVGTLGIYTTGKYTPGEYEGLLGEGLFPSGISRMTSRDLCDKVMSRIFTDMNLICGGWSRRQMYDKNYSETRLPQVPSMILETLSHQNWADMKLGHDPTFKFHFSRSIYKGVLDFVANMHGIENPIVQPLPIRGFAALLDESGDSVTLSWVQTVDPLEPSATPTYYILYTRCGEQGFDNGQKINGTRIKLPVQRNQLMRFYVTAVNEGGQSMNSEELCIFSPSQPVKRILIVNGFQRLAGPQPIDNDSLRGFDMNTDPGVVYKHSPCYSGRQKEFSKSSWETLGQSGAEYEGVFVAGNTFNYPSMHAADIIPDIQGVSISSCSRQAFETGEIPTRGTDILDIILGAQRNDQYSLNAEPCFTKETCQRIEQFVNGGSSLLLSGAYISEEIENCQLADFANSCLHIIPNGAYSSAAATATNSATMPIATCNYSLSDLELVPSSVGNNTSFDIYNDVNEQTYATRRVSVVEPAMEANGILSYAGTNLPAAVVWKGYDGRKSLVYGFPLETIAQKEVRQSIIQSSIKYLIQ